jgi:hypothetical protein
MRRCQFIPAVKPDEVLLNAPAVFVTGDCKPVDDVLFLQHAVKTA